MIATPVVGDGFCIWKGIHEHGWKQPAKRKSFPSKQAIRDTMRFVLRGQDPILWAAIHLALEGHIGTGQRSCPAALIKGAAEAWASGGIPEGPEDRDRAHPLSVPQLGANGLYGTKLSTEILNALIEVTNEHDSRGELRGI